MPAAAPRPATTSAATTSKPFATGTTVAPAKSQEQIERAVARFGATSFGLLKEETRVSIVFVVAQGTENERRVRYTIALPATESMTIVRQPHRRAPASKADAREQEVARLWRALARSIEGKLIAVEENIETFEEAFWAHIITPSGTTIYEETREQIAEAYRAKEMVPLMPGVGEMRVRMVLEHGKAVPVLEANPL